MTKQTKGVTRWRRSAIVGVPALAAVIGMGAAMFEGVLAANITLTGDQENISSGAISAPGGLLVLPDTVGSSNAASTEVGIPSAVIEGLCVHAKHTFTFGAVNVPVDLYIYTPNNAAATTPAQVNADANAANLSGLALNVSQLTLPNATLTPAAGNAVYLGKAAANNASAGILDGSGQFSLDATGGTAFINSLNATPQQVALTTTTTLKNFGIGTSLPSATFGGGTAAPVCN